MREQEARSKNGVAEKVMKIKIKQSEIVVI